MTRTTATLEHYATTSARLVARAREAGQSPGEWLAATAPGLSPATVRLYKAALVWWAEVNGEVECEMTIRAVPVTYAGRTRPLRTSARKKKSVSERNRVLLLKELSVAKSPYARTATDLITAGLVTGLRPCEWQSADLRGRQLTVRNAKATNGRANGVTRSLTLPDDVDVLETVGRLIGTAVADKDWHATRKTCQQLIRRTAKRLWRKAQRRPTLYSARHQFAADLKKTRAKAAVAAALGHATDETSGRHYARARLGRHSAVVAQPVQEEIATVKRVPKGVRLRWGPDGHVLDRGPANQSVQEKK